MHKISQKNLFTPAKLFATSQGFTLIELLVGITIVGILISMGQTTFKRFKFVAARAEAKLNIKSIESLVAIRVSEDPTTTNFQGRYGYLTVAGAFHNTDPDLNDQFIEEGESIGFRVSDPSKLRYYYTFSKFSASASRGRSTGIVTDHHESMRVGSIVNFGDISGLNLENCSREDVQVDYHPNARLFFKYKLFQDSYMIYINDVDHRPSDFPVGQLFRIRNYFDYCTL